MFRFCSLVSGSSGNCLLVQDDSTKILVDCGVSGKNTAQLLKEIGVDINAIDAVLVTHEHSDHVSGIGVISRKYGIPIYANQKTWNAMPRSIGAIRDENRRIVEMNRDFSILSLQIKAFPTPHDAACPCGYNICSNGKKLTIATDLGHLDHALLSNFEQSDFAFIEANHDVEMLIHGTYPDQLKRRILSDFGHLSNQSAGDLASSLVQNGTKNIMLGHLSNENNLPQLAYETVLQAFAFAGIKAGKDVLLSVAQRYCPSQMVQLA